MEPTYIFKEIPNLQGALHPSPYSVSVLTAIHNMGSLSVGNPGSAPEPMVAVDTVIGVKGI
jgi:hypothetical protein